MSNSKTAPGCSTDDGVAILSKTDQDPDVIRSTQIVPVKSTAHDLPVLTDPIGAAIVDVMLWRLLWADFRKWTLDETQVRRTLYDCSSRRIKN